MARKFTQEQAQEKLDCITGGNLRIESWGGSCRKISTVRDISRDVTFSNSLNYIFAGLAVNPNRIWGCTSQERSMVVSASKKTSLEDAQKKLPDYIEIISYGGCLHSPCTVKHKETGKEFTYKKLTDLIQSIKNGSVPSSLGVKPAKKERPSLAKETAIKRLKDKFPTRDYEIIAWGGSARSKDSVFMDKLHNFEFSCSYDYLRDKLKENSERLIGAPSHLVVGERNKTRQERSLDYPLFQDKSPSDWAKELNCSYTYAQDAFRYKNFSLLTDYDPNKSSLESTVEDLLNKLQIDYIHNKKLKDTSFRPDFTIPSHKLIIECDGNYWHSDAQIKDTNYHILKKEAYTKAGYTSLFFRENEIRDKLHIVTSMLLARLGLTQEKYMARKLYILPGNPQFMEEHHLMGSGAGRQYSLFHETKEVAQMQVKWVDKSSKMLEISRFATNGSIISGGFSKLLKHIEEVEQPKIIKTFIDLRYGAGHYLPSLGFSHAGTHKSFVWVYGNNAFHRMKFPGNTGYDHGYHKLWDCGQAKFVKIIT